MSTEMISHFFDGLYSSRLLDHDRIEELKSRPESLRGELDGVTYFLETQGWLTRFQIDEIRQGRGQALTFANYPILERMADVPSGKMFKVAHPTTRQPLILRTIRPDWLQPADEMRGYLDRARVVCQISHPNLLNLVDANLAGENGYVVHEFVEGAYLRYFVTEMGAMPYHLACDYIRESAIALHAGHERGIYHGDLSPASMVLHPVIRKMGANGNPQGSARPAPGATIKLTDLGLTPRRPPASQVSLTQSQFLGAVHFMAPERVNSATQDVRGDIYSLGASLYFLLAARPPHPAVSAMDALLQLQQQLPSRINTLRKDINPGLADLIHRMLSKDPMARPSSAASIVQYLQPFCQIQSGGPPTAMPMAGIVVPDAVPLADAVMPSYEPLPENTSDSQVYGATGHLSGFDGEEPDMFADAPGDEAPRPRRVREESSGGNSVLLIILAVALHVGAIGVLIGYVTGYIKF